MCLHIRPTATLPQARNQTTPKLYAGSPIPHVPHDRKLGFGTFNDADNRAAVAVVRGDVLDLVGPALAAERRLVDKVLKGLALHR